MSNRRKHVFLVGFMGSGKSTVGPLLARQLEICFVDLDNLIEKELGISISQIFKDHGEDSFRTVETRILKQQSTLTGSVIALGGGAFSSLRNREIVEAAGLSVWLKVDLEAARKRCSDTDRPLAQDPDQFARLFRNRQPYYRKADLHIETNDRSPQDIASEIAENIKEFPYALD